MESYKHRPLDGLLSLKENEISNADIVDLFNYAEEKIDASPSGRAKQLALLFYFIKILKNTNLNFYIKGGLLLQYYLKDNARPTHDIDIIIPNNPDSFKEALEKELSEINGPLVFRIVNYSYKPADVVYYYDTFSFDIEVYYKGNKYSAFVLDGVVSSIFNNINPVQYKGPSIITNDFIFNGVPVEYICAEKIIAVTSELNRPFKHLVDLYSLTKLDLNIPLLKSYLEMIIDNDNQIRSKLNKPTQTSFIVKDDKQFAGSYIFPLLEAGYNIPLEKTKLEINNWLSDNL